MIQSVLQRLTIIYQTDARLVLHEQPILDWVIAASLTLTACVMFIAEFWITGLMALGFAAFFFLQAQTRVITFDTDPNLMCVRFQGWLGQRRISELSLHSISRAYLYRGEDGGAQIILTMTDGEEIGLSGYSSDAAAWHEQVVLAINGILHSAHKDDPNRHLMV